MYKKMELNIGRFVLQVMNYLSQFQRNI